jgi:RNA polymerase sigma-70 factor (ECF subfamily)
MSGSRTVAEDVTQEVFMILIRQARTLDTSRGTIVAYLCGAARNLILRKLERDRLYVPITDDEEDGAFNCNHFTASGDPLGDLTHTEMIESVRRAVGSLPTAYREVVVLCDLQEMSYVEAANILGCAIGTVRSRLHRARSLLIEKLGASKRDEEMILEKCNTKRCFA